MKKKKNYQYLTEEKGIFLNKNIETVINYLNNFNTQIVGFFFGFLVNLIATMVILLKVYIKQLIEFYSWIGNRSLRNWKT